LEPILLIGIYFFLFLYGLFFNLILLCVCIFRVLSVHYMKQMTLVNWLYSMMHQG